MCTISCTSDQYDVILDSLQYFVNYWENRLLELDSGDLGSFNEAFLRDHYEMAKDLLDKLIVDLPF